MKLVAARRQIAIESLPTRSCILPGRVVTVKPVAKAYLLWRRKAQRSVDDFEVSRNRRQRELSIRFIVMLVGDNLLDVHRRRMWVERQMVRIRHLRRRVVSEPSPPSVCRFGCCVERRMARFGAVSAVQQAEIQNRAGLAPPAL